MPRKQVSPRSAAGNGTSVGERSSSTSPGEDSFAQPGEFAVSNYAMAAVPLLFTIGWAAMKLQHHPLLWSPLGLLVVVSIIAAQVTNSLIYTVKEWTLKAGLGGFDINKKGTRAGELKVPESLGIVVGTMHMICVILFQVGFPMPTLPSPLNLSPVPALPSSSSTTIFHSMHETKLAPIRACTRSCPLPASHPSFPPLPLHLRRCTTTRLLARLLMRIR
jgi:hypothetical protein